MGWWDEVIVTWTTLVLIDVGNLAGFDAPTEETVNDAETCEVSCTA